jgi:hypothetical protein
MASSSLLKTPHQMTLVTTTSPRSRMSSISYRKPAERPADLLPPFPDALVTSVGLALGLRHQRGELDVRIDHGKKALQDVPLECGPGPLRDLGVRGRRRW